MPTTRKKAYPLPKRFNAALSEKAYARLRELHQEYGFGNNYLLTFLLENLDEIAEKRKLKNVLSRMADEFGSPKGE